MESILRYTNITRKMNSIDSKNGAESTPSQVDQLKEALKDKRAPRIQAKGWFLTWPQCDIEKEQVLVALEQHGAVVEYVIASEKH